MKLCFLLLLCAYLILGTESTDDKYTTKYDNVDIDQVLGNERLLKNYVDCLLDKGSCTPDAMELKSNMPDAVLTECSKCSLKQKEGADKIIRYLIDNKPDYWTPLQVKYDPSGSYKEQYLKTKKGKHADSILEKLN